MARKNKNEEEHAPVRREPMNVCYDCIHWHMNDDGSKTGNMDFSAGPCDHNGYSKVPPLFTCPGWKHGDVEIDV